MNRQGTPTNRDLMIPDDRHRHSLAVVRNCLISLAVGCFVIQCSLDTSVESIQSGLLCLAALIPACLLILHPRTSRGGASLTGAAVLLSILSNSLIPLLGTLLEGHSLIYSLNEPVACFGHRFVFSMVLLTAHFMADSAFGRSAKSTCGSAADFLGLRSVLDARQIWVVGLIGIMLMLALRIGVFGSGALSKVIQPMGFLAIVPLILLVPPFSRQTRKSTAAKIGIAIVYITYVTLGITSRMAMVGPIAMVGTAYLIALLAGYASLPRINPFKGILLLLGALFLTGQLSDLSDAILSVRDRRAERTTVQNLSATFTNFWDKEYLRAYKKQKAAELERLESKYGEFWKEDYINNPFLSRFTGIKADDNLFTTVSHYSQMDVRMLRMITNEKIFAQLPEPVIRMFGISIQKEFVNSFSMGDFMDVLVNRNGFLGGFRTGSLLAHSYALLGWWYPFWLTLIMLILFLIFQYMAIPDGKGGHARGLSSFALLYGFTLYLGFASEGYNAMVSQLVRSIWQVLLLYGLVTWIAKAIAGSGSGTSGSAPRGRRRRQPKTFRGSAVNDGEAPISPAE